ncbi:MAG: M23 family metallopeptidase, partial [Mucinivorans sp.]
SVPVGTAVFATADGYVDRIENNGQSSGLSLQIQHSKRYETLYANLDKILVEPGRRVVRGDVIAFTGNSGLSFAPHLHYEVRQNGVAVNPLPFFFAELSIGQKAKMKRVASVGMQSFD